MMNRLKKGDTVIVISGRDKGKRGVILSCGFDGRVIVEGVNRVKKHVKPNPMKNESGGIREQELSINSSNVAVYNSVNQKADRVGFKLLSDGRKVRVFRSNGETIDREG